MKIFDAQQAGQLSHWQLDWLERLHDIALSICDDEPQQIEQRLLEHLVSGIGASSGSLATIEPAGNQLTLSAATGRATDYIGKKITLGEGIMGQIAVERVPRLMTGNVVADQRDTAKTHKQNMPKCAICWPLLVKKRLRGVVCLNRREGLEPFIPKDIEHGQFMVNILAIVVDNIHLRHTQHQRIAEQQALIKKLNEIQEQLLQSEKMAAIGQLAAGVAHEINNPVGYVNSNLGSLKRYINDIFSLLDAYEMRQVNVSGTNNQYIKPDTLRKTIDLDFLREDTVNLVKESQEGLDRVKKIVQDLKEFSHVNRPEWQDADLHKGLDSTLNIVHNELKYKAKVVKEYGTIPLVECIPAQINQVFMNLLINAAQAIKHRGTITIRTGTDGDGVSIEVTDTGKGMTEEVKKRIFEPFFTTKPVGKGTGLGLSLSHNIIVTKHHGRIGATSTPKQGTVFRMWLPIRQPMEQEQPELKRAST